MRGRTELKTEDLIEQLAADGAGRHPRRLMHVTVAAALASFIVAAASVYFHLGFRPDLVSAAWGVTVELKFGFALATAVLSGLVMMHLSRPGRRLGEAMLVLVVPFAVVAILAAADLAGAPPMEREAMVFGSSWSSCLTTIPLLALVPLGAMILALRDAAPTDRAGAGFAAGLCAGALTTFAYGLHCTEDAMPFVAAWYGGAILIVGALGAILAPRLVRW